MKKYLVISLLLSCKCFSQFMIGGAFQLPNPLNFIEENQAQDFLNDLKLEFPLPNGDMVNNQDLDEDLGLDPFHFIDDDPQVHGEFPEDTPFDHEGWINEIDGLPPLDMDDLQLDTITNSSLEDLLANIDSDDDSSNLEMINDNLTDQANNIRGVKKILTIDATGTSFSSTSDSQKVTLSDLHQELQKIRLYAMFDKNSSQDYRNEQNETIQEAINNEENDITTDIANITEKATQDIGIEEVEDSGTDSFTAIPLQPMVSEALGQSTLNLFDVSSISEYVPSLDTFASWVALVIGLYAVFIYTTLIKELILEVMTDLTRANESNAVTNLSVLGNSVGALVLKGSNVAIMLAGIATIILSILNVFNETIGIGSLQHNVWNISALLWEALLSSSDSNWTKMALYWFCRFVPVFSILTMIGFYWLNKFTFKGLLLGTNRLARISS